MELGQWQPLPNRRRLRYRPAVFLSHLRLSGLQFTQKKKNRRAFQKCYSNFNFFNCVILKPRNLQFSKSVYYLGKIRRMENAFK